MRFSLLLAAALLAGFTSAPLVAEAAPGDTLDRAMKTNRAFKKDVMGVAYYVRKNKVGAEYWSSELAGWDRKTADKLRAVAVGKTRKLRAVQKGEVVNPDVFKYVDGSVVHYNIRHGRVITMDVAGPGFLTKDVARDKKHPELYKKDLAAGMWEKLDDWKENPLKGKKW